LLEHADIRPDEAAAQTVAVAIQSPFEYTQMVRRLTDRQVWR
jgi:hypothetical protein